MKNQLIDKQIVAKWQEKIDLLQQLLQVSAAILMKLHPRELEVYLSSRNEKNPYAVGDRGEINIGSYCDSIIASKAKVQIEDASDDEYWRDKLEFNNGMSCYIGLPIFYPNQDLFGTLCVLNKECRKFADLDHQLLDRFRIDIESDLKMDQESEENQ
jgi:transcriptional regulator with GAF, ATPase, and Fis domain